MQANTTSIYLSWEEPTDNNALILMYQITLQVVGDKTGNASVFTSATTELTAYILTFTHGTPWHTRRQCPHTSVANVWQFCRVFQSCFICLIVIKAYIYILD